MKKLVNKLNFALIAIMTTVPLFAADTTAAGSEKAELCNLLKRLSGVFGWIRNLAFIGAAFIIAAWAWDFISKGEVKMDDVKKKGIGMFVGFALLFMIGILVQFLMSAAGGEGFCAEVFKNWGQVYTDL